MRRSLRWLVAAGWLWLLALTLLALLGYGVRRHNFEAAGIAFGVGLLSLSCGHLSRQTDATHRVTSKARQPPWLTLIPAGLAVVGFSWSVGLGPLSDDFVLRRWAVAGEWTPSSWDYVRPFPLAIWQAILAAGGGWAALHLLNILLHAMNSALVAHIGGSWLGPHAGVSAGAIFAIFPTATEAVGWTAGIFDLASTGCALSAIALSLSEPVPQKRTLAILFVCVAGFFSKESAIAIPALLLLVAAVSPVAWSRNRVAQLFLVGLLSIGYVGLRAMSTPAVAGHLQNLPGDRRQWKDLLVRPFSGLAVPMRTDMGTESAAYFGGILLLAMFAIAVVRVLRASARGGESNREAAVLCIGIGWIVISTLPLLLSFYVAPNLEGSRYLYLPSVGFALAASVAFARSDGRGLNLAASIALVGLLGLFATRLNQERQLWFTAASMRDVLLTEAAGAARALSCGTLSVQGAPDSIRGIFVFRQGLPEALGSIATTSGGKSCLLRWTGSELIVEDLLTGTGIERPRLK